ncbi:MAG: integral rane sensor signal transduction histidine kinase [Acidimicrobiales bacterium]|nr:integral rane sensor signal transduction histidine kinase [Acidimicrobiales bacterium]
MTLRLRLVVALALLLVIGMTGFGFVTYRLFERSQRQRLDDQLRAAAPAIPARLRGTSEPGSPTAPPREIVGLDTYGELRASSGARTGATVRLTSSAATPSLPQVLDPGGPRGRFLTTGSSTGSGSWRVFVSRPRGPSSEVVVVALPLASVTGPLHRLVLIEALAGGGLVLLIGAGSWLIMRRGLRPLEQMAGSARTIAAGDLSLRVAPSDDRSEVGQLGLALNTMLGEIEASFREREATEARLRQFLADASHELRTPLTSIQGFAELFRLGAQNDHVDLPVIMRRIEQESARMKDLVEDLLLLARLDQTRATERRPVDLAVLAADACSDAVAADPTRSLSLDAPEPVVVTADSDHVRQALANLVANAMRHTPAATAVEVSARAEGGEAVLSVRDHGPGLSDEALEHVFDRFWQADGARTGAGAGLGLAIVAAIAAEHDGSVRVANAADGGAVFTIRIPLGGRA